MCKSVMEQNQELKWRHLLAAYDSKSNLNFLPFVVEPEKVNVFVSGIDKLDPGRSSVDLSMN